MGSEWTYPQLNQVAKLVGGFAFKSKDFQPDGVPVAKIKNVRHRDIDLSDVDYVSKETANSCSKFLIKNGDILISMTGSGMNAPASIVGRVARHNGQNNAFLINQRVGRFNVLSPDKLDLRYLYYYFSQRDTQLELVSIATGSANQVNLSATQIESLEIPLPPLPEQKAIAHILGTLDDKIELNRRMNATLEGMAQALFKSWFVDFDPVIDNALAAGNPIPEELAPRAKVRRQALTNGTTNREAAKPFPAAFQETESMGWIPEGWTLQSFESLATLDTESVKPFEQPSTVWEHYSIPSYDSTGMPSWDRGDEIKSNKYRVKSGAILSSKLNPETERTWWPFMLDGEAAICSTEFMQFVPKNLDEQAFVYSLIRSEPFQANILERVTGSTGSRQRAQPKEIAKIGLLDCGETLRAEFAKVALPLFQSVRSNSLQNQTLTKLRDTLLPKLISRDTPTQRPQASTVRPSD